MTKRNDKSGDSLSPTKTCTQAIHDSNSYDKLAAIEQQLSNVVHAQQFYHHALIHLLTADSEPECLIGALVVQQWLEDASTALLKDIQALQ